MRVVNITSMTVMVVARIPCIIVLSHSTMEVGHRDGCLIGMNKSNVVIFSIVTILVAKYVVVLSIYIGKMEMN